MKKNIFILLLLLGSITLVLGITYAYYTFSINLNTDLTSECFDITYAKGQDIGSNENSRTLYIGDNFRRGLSSTMNIKVNGSCGIASSGKGYLYLNTDSSTRDELIQSGALCYTILEGLSVIKSDVVTSKEKLLIYDFDVTTTNREITVYVWIDSSKVTNDNVNKIINSNYKGYISVRAESR